MNLMKNLMNKKSFIVVVVVFTAILVTMGQQSFAQNVITLATPQNPQLTMQLKPIIDSINENSSSIRLNHVPVPGNFQAYIQGEIANGSGADIYWVSQEDMSLALQDSFQALNMCMAHEDRYSVGDMSDYHSQIIETGVINQIMYGLPVRSSPIVAYLNADLFTEAGVELPSRYWNWNDLQRLAKSLTIDTDGDDFADQWGFVADGSPPPQMFLWQAGGNVIGYYFDEVSIDSPEAISALEFYRSFAPNRQRLASNASAESLFRAGSQAIYFGSAANNNFQGLNNVVMQQVPRHPETNNNTTFAWTELLAISRNSTNPEACDVMQKIADAVHLSMGSSPRISHSTPEIYAELNPVNKDFAETVLNSMQQMRSPKVFETQNEFYTVFWTNLIAAMMSGDVTGDAAMSTTMSTTELVELVKPMLETHLPPPPY